ncbi:MAG TPA: VOC family protein [Dehalococcoidia bacterium]|nr:VOC family protein [Dehalococcoidia bacterium]
MPEQQAGFVPYLHYDDVPPVLEWLARVFGFVELKRWPDESGVVRNAEMRFGDTEVWLDGSPGWWETRGGKPDGWIGVWVDDVDAMYARVKGAGVEPDGPPEDKPYGVRVFSVRDPGGYSWGFMRRI